MEIPDIVQCIAVLLPMWDRVCLGLVNRMCYASLRGVFVSYRGDALFHLLAEEGSLRQAYWWLARYQVPWDEDDAHVILRRLGQKGFTRTWPNRFLSIFSEQFHSMDEVIIDGRIEACDGNDGKLLDYAAELLWNVYSRQVDWDDETDTFSRTKLQSIMEWAAEQNVCLHHNLCQRFGIDFPATTL